MLRRIIIIFLTLASVVSAYGWYESYFEGSSRFGRNVSSGAGSRLLAEGYGLYGFDCRPFIESRQELRPFLGGWSVGTSVDPSNLHEIGFSAWRGSLCVSRTVEVPATTPTNTRLSEFAGFGLAEIVGLPRLFGDGHCMAPMTEKHIHRKNATTRCLIVHAPFWAVFTALAAYPTITLILWPIRRRHRKKKGFCTSCGYNLTGLPEPRCPECGQAVSNATQNAA